MTKHIDLDALQAAAEARNLAGAQLANVAFNWAQQMGHTLTSDDCMMLDKIRRQWDENANSIPYLIDRLRKAEAARDIDSIDSRFTQRLALLLECMMIDPNGHWNQAANLLDEYKAAWDKINPTPPTFMGEPMPPERRARLMTMKENRAAPDSTPTDSADSEGAKG